MATLFAQETCHNERQHTFSNIFYLLLSFPLGLIYFVLTVVGLSVGISTIIVWIGLPILLLTLLGIRGVATLERDLAANMLHMDMPHVKNISTGEGKLLTWIYARVRDALTWRCILYILIKFPLSIISFCLALTLPLIALTFFLEPGVYLLNVYIGGIVHSAGHHSHSILPFFVSTEDGSFNLTMLALSFLGTPCGIILWYLTRYILNGLAHNCGLFTRAMLCSTSAEHSQPKEEYYRG